MRLFTPQIVAIFLAMTAVARAAEPSGDSVPDYSKYTQSYRVPFANAVDYNRLKTMEVRVSLNGGPPIKMQVDTGSVGVIAGASDIRNVDPNAPAGSITYSSSGVEIDGVWTPVTITFLDAKDADGKPLTAQVPVLAAMERKTSGIGVNAGKVKPPQKNPKIYMFGVGFGRGKEAHPERNPFLNLAAMHAGTMRRGYTITPAGYALGLTPDVVGSGYVFQKLKEKTLIPEVADKTPGLKDWQTTPGSVTVKGETSPMGLVLMDTGLTNMILGSDNPTLGDVPDGTDITVNLLSGKLHYSFKVGDKDNPLTPRKVSNVKSSLGGITINTGLHALTAFDYLFDGDGGYLALRPLTRPVNPS
jgi:hypothetical protein